MIQYLLKQSGTACREGHRGVCMVSGSPPGITASHGGGGPGPPAKPELSPDGKSIWSPIKTSPTWSSDLKQHGTPASASYEQQRSRNISFLYHPVLETIRVEGKVETVRNT